jgi:hypothetical protein
VGRRLIVRAVPRDPFTVVVWRDQAEHAAASLAKGSRVVVVGGLQQRAWTAEDGSARSVVEVGAVGLGGGPALGDDDQGDPQLASLWEPCWRGIGAGITRPG